MYLYEIKDQELSLPLNSSGGIQTRDSAGKLKTRESLKADVIAMFREVAPKVIAERQNDSMYEGSTKFWEEALQQKNLESPIGFFTFSADKTVNESDVDLLLSVFSPSSCTIVMPDGKFRYIDATPDVWNG